MELKGQDHDDDEVQSSQDLGLDLMKHAQDMMAAAKSRKEIKRQGIKEEHVKHKKDLARRINLLFKTRAVNGTKIQKVQWDRLNNLNKKRTTLEAHIIASMRSIEQHTFNITNELSAMFAGRKEDLTNPPPT